jgi:trk system potassium uptake protein TrkH
MLKTGPILYVLGLILLALGIAMAATAGFDAFIGEGEAWSFLFSAFVTMFAGGALVFSNRSPHLDFDQRQAFVLTFLAWTVGCAFAALPFVFWRLSYTDAFFETMSGLTTTGGTVIVGLDTAPKAVLLWRSILQGLGGIGIVVMAIAILPFLRIGGMQLFKTESSDKSEKVLPRPGQVAAATAQIFLGLTLVCAVAYMLAGMSGFDAVNHALTTVATAGFSTHDMSFAYFEDDPAIQWVATVFMIMGALPFVLYVKVMQGDPNAFFTNPQVRTFLLIISLAIACVTANLIMTETLEFWPALRHAAFNLVSIITTTGFASHDYIQWQPLPLVIIFFLTFVGGCSGSSSGGIKIFRFQIIAIALRMQVLRMIHPHAVTPRQYTGMRLSDDLILSVLIFVAVYFLTVAITAALLAALGLDFITSISGAAQAVGNVGPGLGDIIGPVGNFSTIPDGAKWTLAVAMLLGRLELMTVVVLLTPAFWRS